jgi:hypothetical protein
MTNHKQEKRRGEERREIERDKYLSRQIRKWNGKVRTTRVLKSPSQGQVSYSRL